MMIILVVIKEDDDDDAGDINYDIGDRCLGLFQGPKCFIIACHQ